MFSVKANVSCAKFATLQSREYLGWEKNVIEPSVYCSKKRKMVKKIILLNLWRFDWINLCRKSISTSLIIGTTILKFICQNFIAVAMKIANNVIKTAIFKK